MEKALKEGGAISPHVPPRRCFHYTKSPLEEILDADGYLYTPETYKEGLEKLPFSIYMMNRGYTIQEITKLIYYPIVKIKEDGNLREVYLYEELIGDSYEEAFKKISLIQEE